MNVGDVFLWKKYPYNKEGISKPRWFVYLGEYRETEDPLDEITPVMIIAPTTTSQLHYYVPGEPREKHPYVRFTPQEGFGFASECILDLHVSDIVIEKIIFRNCERAGNIVLKGILDDQKLREIYKKIYSSSGYSPKLKRQIRQNFNHAGITGLPLYRRRK